jgi:hypothetical protein
MAGRPRRRTCAGAGNTDLRGWVERALDALIEAETKKRLGAGRPRKQRKLKAGSRHVPVEVARVVWKRDTPARTGSWLSGDIACDTASVRD